MLVGTADTAGGGDIVPSPGDALRIVTHRQGLFNTSSGAPKHASVYLNVYTLLADSRPPFPPFGEYALPDGKVSISIPRTPSPGGVLLDVLAFSIARLEHEYPELVNFTGIPRVDDLECKAVFFERNECNIESGNSDSPSPTIFQSYYPCFIN